MECLIVCALPTLQMRPFYFLACKNAWKCWISTLIFWKIFWGIAPRPPYWGGATAPLPRPHPPRRSGASRLPRLARDLRSLHRQAVIWDDFRHTNPEMLPAPLTPCPDKNTHNLSWITLTNLNVFLLFLARIISMIRFTKNVQNLLSNLLITM